MDNMWNLDPRDPNMASYNNLMSDVLQITEIEFDSNGFFAEKANDPSAISKILDGPPHLKYANFYRGLLFVRKNNIPALNKFKKMLRNLFNDTILYRTSLEDAKKICVLIETTPKLHTIYESLNLYIEHIKQLRPEEEEENVAQLNSLIAECAPDTLEVKEIHKEFLNPLNDIDCESYANDHLEEVKTAHRNSILENPTIVTQDIDGIFAKWLTTFNFGEYQWFFNGLSYLEIMLIEEKNIENAIAKVNKMCNTTHVIPRLIQKEICIMTKALKNRSVKIKNIIPVLNEEAKIPQLLNIILYMRDILQYPIPNRNCVAGEVLQEDIITIMQLFLTEIVRHLFSVKFLNAESPLGTIIHKYTECIFLIKGNQMFMKRHIGLVKFWYGILVDIVSSMDNKDFD